MKKAFGKQRKYVSLVLMIVITCITQVASVMKSSVVAGTFGASAEMDAFSLANSIVSFLFGLIASGITTVIIPCYADENEKKNANAFITILYSAMAVVVALVILLRWQIVDLLSSRDDFFVGIVCELLVVLFLSQFLLSFANITAAYFQCREKYNIPKIINLLVQCIVIGVLLVFECKSIVQYAWIVAGGAVLNFVFDVGGALLFGWRFCPTLSLSAETRRIFKTFFPIVFSSGVYSLTLLVDSLIASNLEVGKGTILNYSTQISSMVNSLLIANLLTYIYPKIVKDINSPNAKETFWERTVAMHAIASLVVAGFFTVGQEGVNILFCRGAMTLNDCKMIFLGAAIYIFGHQISIIRNLVYRFFYAKRETGIPAKNSIFVSLCNLILSIALVYIIGFYGIIIGTLLSSLISTTLIIYQFKKTFGLGSVFKRALGRYFLDFAITIATIAVVWGTKQVLHLENEIVKVLVFGLETVAVYAGLTMLLNKRTIKSFGAL